VRPELAGEIGFCIGTRDADGVEGELVLIGVPHERIGKLGLAQRRARRNGRTKLFDVGLLGARLEQLLLELLPLAMPVWEM
jgi:hypothetical protein